MAKCDFCGKEVSFGIRVSHSHRRSNRTWKPNVKRVKAIVDGTPKRVHACTRCLRSGKKFGSITNHTRCTADLLSVVVVQRVFFVFMRR